ncbi:MAG TPA: sigma-E factor regulatory protein RseB domain-containing protein [Trebonia sp.]|jgi:sigma-E factor negative regulatory protein RseB|nr:sigma-E factor regulatory protein RseB domain-containing protein [Trebonia sp.]
MMSLLRRPVLLLSAAATVTVPGALAAFAVLGHDHGVSASVARAESVAAQPGGQRASSRQASAEEVSGAQADLLPGVKSAGPGLSPVGLRMGAATAAVAAARNQTQGMQLLQEAAQSGALTSYQGVEMISDNVVGGNATVVAKVWHRGGVTVTQTSGATALNGSQPYVSYDGDNRDPEGVFGLTTTLVGLLAKNYVPVYEGQGTAIGRPALLVGVRRADGSLAAQFWLDKQTKLPLRRDVYDTQSRLVSDDKFVQVSFGRLPVPAAGDSTAQAASPTWTAAPVPVTFLKELDGQGWRLPVALPGNLDLYAAAETSTTSGQVVDLGFSDGLSVVSLFVQRGTLPGAMPGWRADRIGDHAAYVDGHEVTVSAQGYVYTLVADAPAPVMDDAVAALPRQKAPGVLGRIGRGFARLATLANPFK